MFDQERPSAYTGNTFIIRIWLEWSKAGPCWRGQVTHVQSGRKVAFLCLDEMMGFVRSYVSMPKVELEERGNQARK